MTADVVDFGLGTATEALTVLFHPRSIAILGASDNPMKIGGRPLRFLKESGFAGGVFPINPRRSRVQGVEAYASLSDVAAEVDLALIAVPRDDVFAAVQECVAKGVRCATIFSSGFAEADTEGARLQKQIADYARENGLRLLGPNCIGSRALDGGVIATFAAVEGVPRPEFLGRRVAFVSQSGAIAAHCVLEAFDRGLGFDPWISTGNEADIQFADALAFLAEDDSVDAIAAYMEGCRDGERLAAALAIAHERRKPVFMLKVGRSDIGARAAASHTASLVGSEAVYEALFRRYNVCRVESLAELLDVSYLFAVGVPPRGDRMAMVTGSGGVGILMADTAADIGLSVPALTLEAQSRLKQLAPAAGVANPLDTTAQVMNDPDLLSEFLSTVMETGQYDGVVAFLTYMGKVRPWADSTVDSLRAVRRKHPDASFAVAMTSSPGVRREVEELGIPVFDDVVVLLRAIAKIVALQRGFDDPGDYADPGELAARPANLPLTEIAALATLEQAGLPVVAQRVAHSAREAGEIAAAIGFPVVMKVVSEQITHKTEAGGVLLGVLDARAAEVGYEQIQSAASSYDSDARLDGVLVAPMVRDGVEVILGVQNDPTFGPTVMFGLGGIFVEVLKDVSYRLAPFGPKIAREMIEEIRGFPLLEGVRGAAASDLEAVAVALSDLSVFASANRDWVGAVDVNPFRVFGVGALALDALITVRPGADTNGS